MTNKNTPINGPLSFLPARAVLALAVMNTREHQSYIL